MFPLTVTEEKKSSVEARGVKDPEQLGMELNAGQEGASM